MIYLLPVSKSGENWNCKFSLMLFYGSESQKKIDFFDNTPTEI